MIEKETTGRGSLEHVTFSRQMTWEIAPTFVENEKLIVFSACDGKYLDYAIPLIRSLDLFSPGFIFFLHLVNPQIKDIQRVKDFSRCLKNTRLAFSHERVQFDEGVLPETIRSYFASVRFLLLPDLLKEYGLPVFCVDADSLFVNPIDFNFWDHHSDQDAADVLLYLQDQWQNYPEKWRVKNGSIWVRPVEGIRTVLLEVKDELIKVFKVMSAKWYIDQIIFSRVLLKSQEIIKIGRIHEKYADWSFRGSSIVWTAKGKTKNVENPYAFLTKMLSDQRPESLCVSNNMLNSFSLDFKRFDKQVAVFLPRFDLPWKLRWPGTDQLIPKLKEDTLALRLYWKQFVSQLGNVFERRGIRVEMFEWPAWRIQPDEVDRLGFPLAFIPHRCHLNFKAGSTKIFFFMQEFFRWVFVVNSQGWSASSSVYPVLPEKLTINNSGAFKVYRKRLAEGHLESKFFQANTVSREFLISSGQIPNGEFVFFPLQIPHDQSIAYFSDFSEEKVVAAMLDWSASSGVPVVFKPHPVNKESMILFEEMAKPSRSYWSTAHVHDLIKYSSAVFTINSGVGFEALLQLKPVVTFGKVEYDCVCFKARLENISDAWKYCKETNWESLLPRYQAFIDWFLSCYAVDLSRPKYALPRFDSIADDVFAELSK